jgi:hypothetical protein
MMNPDNQPVNTAPGVEQSPMFLSHEPNPANRPSDDDIQSALDTLEKETGKTYVYNNSKFFRRKIEKQFSLGRYPDSSNQSRDEKGEHSESSNTSYFLDDSTEDALQNIREWVWRNDPTLHKDLLASEEHGTVPLLLDLCNQLCDRSTAITENEAKNTHHHRHEQDVIVGLNNGDQNTKALDQVVKILMDATHEGHVQQTAHVVAAQFFAVPISDSNARGTHAFFPDNYGPKVLTKVLRQHLYNADLQKHGWVTLGNVLNNAPRPPPSEARDWMDDDAKLISSLLEAALTCLQVHSGNCDVIHVVLNSVGTMIHKSPAFRQEFLMVKENAFAILDELYQIQVSNLEHQGGTIKGQAMHNYLSVASRWLRLVFYLTRTSKTSMDDGSEQEQIMDEDVQREEPPVLSEQDWYGMLQTVLDIVNRLPLEREEQESDVSIASEEKDQAQTFLLWLQVQVIQKMACSFLDTCLHHGASKGFLMDAGVVNALGRIAEKSSNGNQRRHPEATADEATKMQALRLMNMLLDYRRQF